MEMQNRMTEYVDLFEEVRGKVGDDQIAVALVEQVGKDSRTELLRANRAASSEDVDPTAATRKQIGFLKRLGVEVPAGVSKQDASELIDQAQDKQ